MTQELKRKILHITMVGFALLIGRISASLIVLLCLAAFVHNLFVLPWITRKSLLRDTEKKEGYSLGMLLYPAVLFLLSLLFYKSQVFVAIAWGMMAFGDGFASIIGRKIGGPTLPWNRDKRLSGTLGFMLMGIVLTQGLIFCLPQSTLLGLEPLAWFGVIVASGIASGLAESVRGLVNDNLSVPLTAAGVAWYVHGLSGLPPLPANWLVGLVLVLLLTFASILSKKIDVPGGLMGMLLATCIFLGGGLMGLSLLFAFFLVGSFASHWKAREKEKMGLAQENKGRRSVRHAVSNAGAAACCGLLAWSFPENALLFQGMLAASLASACADTCSSELGNVYGRKFINVLHFKPEPRGLDGVISLEGTLLGAAASFLIAAIALMWGLDLKLALLVAAGGIFGNYIDSVLGATLQRSGAMTNDTVNLANTVFGALFFLALFSTLGLA